MERARVIYAAYMLFFLALVGLIIATPLLAFRDGAPGLYGAFGPTCHQKLSRSLCIFSDNRSYWMGDCTPQDGRFVTGADDRNATRVEGDGVVGYKMPVCSRDFGIYGAMLLGGALYPFVRRMDERKLYPALWLIVALVPLALDGGLQLVSETGLLPFVYESSNALRLLTGAIAGFAAAFYTIPLLMNLFTAEMKEQRK